MAAKWVKLHLEELNSQQGGSKMAGMKIWVRIKMGLSSPQCRPKASSASVVKKQALPFQPTIVFHSL
jgi:hypothetical protein